MNLCIDQGNSSTKVGIFRNNKLLKHGIYDQFGTNELSSICQEFSVSNCILSSVKNDTTDLCHAIKNACQNILFLDSQTPVPITNRYQSPETLGIDRLAALCGARSAKPNSDILVIDAGTAITYDFIDKAGIFNGGNIAPGVEMRLKSMHYFTEKLPLISAKENFPEMGSNTETALRAGSMQGIIFEINGYIDLLKINFPQLSVFLTGGSIFYFVTKLKTPIFVEPNLVLIGLNNILQYNAQK